MWTEFVPVRNIAPAASQLESLSGASILVTGAGGSIGSALASSLATCRPAHLTLVDLAEQGLYALDQHMARAAQRVPRTLMLGSITDDLFIRSAFATRRPDIVFHAAALKHVPLLEANPIAAAQVNVLGTEVVLRHAAASGVADLIHVSTDKAVDPISILGATKRLAERMVFATTGATAMKAVRLPNVLGSSGSVGPLFLEQIARGGPVTVAGPDVTRYFATVAEVISLLLSAAVADVNGVLVPDVGPPRRVLDLAHFLIDHESRPGQEPPSMQFVGLRPGDKLHEQMLSSRETLAQRVPGTSLSLIKEAGPAASPLQDALPRIRSAVADRDARRLITALRDAVPEYVTAHPLQAIDVPQESPA